MFLGRSVTQHKSVSSQTAIDIDIEVRSVIDRCYARAREMLVENRDILDSMSEALMKYETIDAPQIDDLMARREVRPPKGWTDDGSTGGGNATAPTEAKDDVADSATPAPDAV